MVDLLQTLSITLLAISVLFLTAAVRNLTKVANIHTRQIVEHLRFTP